MHGKASATVATSTTAAPAPAARDPAYGHSTNKRVHLIAGSFRSSRQQQQQQASTQKYHRTSFPRTKIQHTKRKKKKEKKGGKKLLRSASPITQQIRSTFSSLQIPRCFERRRSTLHYDRALSTVTRNNQKNKK